jgi:hypothetical protein
MRYQPACTIGERVRAMVRGGLQTFAAG